MLHSETIGIILDSCLKGLRPYSIGYTIEANWGLVILMVHYRLQKVYLYSMCILCHIEVVIIHNQQSRTTDTL